MKFHKIYLNFYNILISLVYTRQEYEGVSSIDASSPTFLDDSYIINNKPYLPWVY